MYEFQHTTNLVARGENRAIETPLWVVGHSPFDEVQSMEEGYVVHLAPPRFIARWYLGDEPENPSDLTSGITFHDEELELSLCELVFLDPDPQIDSLEEDLDPWLQEAMMAVAVWRGDMEVGDEGEI